MDTETFQKTAKHSAELYHQTLCGMKDEIQAALKEAAEQAMEEEKEDYTVTVNHSVKINPVKKKLDHKVSISIAYTAKCQTNIPDPNQPDLFNDLD